MKGKSFVQLSGGRKKSIVFKLKGIQAVAGFFACTLPIVVSILLPIIVLIFVAGPFSTYIKAFKSSFHQVGYSLTIAFWSSLFTMLLGFCMAYLIERSQNKYAHLLSWLGLLPLAIPATTVGIGLIGVWNREIVDVVYSSSIIMIVGNIVLFIPFSILVFLSGISQISRHVEEAAALAGHSFLSLTGKVVFPLLKQSFLAVLFIVFVLSIGELSTTLLVIPPGRETIPIKIYNLMHYGADEQVAALCLILISAILFISSLFMILYRKVKGDFSV